MQVNLQPKPGEPISGEGPDCRTRPLAPIAKEALPSGRSAPAQFLGPAPRPSLQALAHGQHGGALCVLRPGAFASALSRG